MAWETLGWASGVHHGYTRQEVLALAISLGTCIPARPLTGLPTCCRLRHSTRYSTATAQTWSRAPFVDGALTASAI